ncbi:MAG: TonB-dependent receptor [Bacteroidales bacterium]|nr:TonB-dependent receptor [Bacteroidales bacterium]MBQ5892064.1 TonB-dependent receptor [Bacteroidales bacterium]MED9962755.1 TonB-dependent receptor [Bacteroidales bacterium]MEE0267591.1 TonB-dependent receptor [Bacteroidales bacterium]
MKKVLVLIFTIITTMVSAQTGSIRGFVYDKETGEPMMLTNVVLENTLIGTTTDVNGYFVLSKIKTGDYNIKVTLLGYETYIAPIKIEKNKVLALKIDLSPSATELQTVEIQGKQEVARTESQVSIEKITSKDIQQMPSIGGQADLAQYIQVLPGVVFSGDQGGQLYIRGGSAIHNKVLLDGMVVYNPFHSIGLFSVFETDIIRNADIYTGGFSAQYGGRISSVMDITTKDGNKKHFSGKLAASTFGANLLLEGPLLKKKDYSLSYILSAKNSYLSKTSTSIYSYMNKELPYDYFDLYGKLTLATDNGSKINFFGLNFSDKVNQYEAIADFNWVNRAFGTNFLLIPGTSSALVEGVVAYSDYTMNMRETTTNQNQMSNIGGFNVGLSVTNFFGDDRLKYGMEMEGNTTRTAYKINDTITDYSTEIGLYAIYKLLYRSILLEPSLRLNYYASLGNVFLEPRLSAKWNITKKFRLKLATGVYSQTFLDTKSDRDIVNLFTGYMTVNPDLNIVGSFRGEDLSTYVQKSNHFIFGAEYDILRNFNLNVELYYKTMSNLTSVNRERLYADDPEHSDKPEYQRKEYTVENGKAYGADFSLKYDDGRLYVWTIYSLGKVIREGEMQTYSPHYDRRHNVNVLINYQMGQSRDFEISLRWNYGSGFPYSPTASMVEMLDFSNGINSDYISQNGTLTTIYGELNSERLPNYHRLDLSAKKRFDIGKRSILEINLSVTNVYNRNNLFYWNRITSQRVDQLPIMPSLGITYTF